MKKMLLTLLAVGLLAACTPSGEQPPATETPATQGQTEPATTATEAQPASETETPATETPATEDASAKAWSRVTLAGALDAAWALDGQGVTAVALAADPEDGETAAFVAEIRNGQIEQRAFTLPAPATGVGAVALTDGAVVFTTHDLGWEKETADALSIWRLPNGSEEPELLYTGSADEHNRGRSLAAHGDTVAFVESVMPMDGMFAGDLCLLRGDAKEVVNVEIFPTERVSLLLDGEALRYAAARNDELFVVDVTLGEPNTTREYAVAGDNASFRLTDAKDGKYLLDNFNYHPETMGTMVLRLDSETFETGAYSQEGKNVHTAVFGASDDKFTVTVAERDKAATAEVNAADRSFTEQAPAFEIPVNTSLSVAKSFGDGIWRTNLPDDRSEENPVIVILQPAR